MWSCEFFKTIPGKPSGLKERVTIPQPSQEVIESSPYWHSGRSLISKHGPASAKFSCDGKNAAGRVRCLSGASPHPTSSGSVLHEASRPQTPRKPTRNTGRFKEHSRGTQEILRTHPRNTEGVDSREPRQNLWPRL